MIAPTLTASELPRLASPTMLTLRLGYPAKADVWNSDLALPTAPPPPPDGQGTAAPTATGGALPATGWSSPVGLATLLVVLAVALRRLHGGAA